MFFTFFTIVSRCLHRVKAAEGIRTRKLRWLRSNILPVLPYYSINRKSGSVTAVPRPCRPRPPG